MKRHIVFPQDFDSRASGLEEIPEHWEDNVKKIHLENQEKLIKRLKVELGEVNFPQKLKNFKDSGHAPFSIISHHNGLYHQARYSFIHSLYYPSLTAACALGERILNHLILDLRESFKNTPAAEKYKNLYKKDSFNKWGIVIKALKEWGVFQHKDIEGEFLKLETLRHKSIHFNPDTYKSLRDDALEALTHLAKIISLQFGFFGGQKWMIANTAGAAFIKKQAENDPFLMKYYLPQSPRVTPYYAMLPLGGGAWLFFDWKDHKDREISDEEFANLYAERKGEELPPTDIPWKSNIIVQTIIDNKVRVCGYKDEEKTFAAGITSLKSD